MYEWKISTWKDDQLVKKKHKLKPQGTTINFLKSLKLKSNWSNVNEDVEK